MIYRKEMSFDVDSDSGDRVELTSDRGELFGVNVDEINDHTRTNARCSKCGKIKDGYGKGDFIVSSIINVNTMIPVNFSKKVSEVIAKTIQDSRDRNFICDDCINLLSKLSEEDVAHER
ncbi:hypothetical protein J7J13_01265 [bacterium]|nr:hypothetical protein [bacterium]